MRPPLSLQAKDCLRFLAASPVPMTCFTLAAKRDQRWPEGTYRVLDSLVRKGLVTTSVGEKGRLYTLSDEGRVTVDALPGRTP